MHDYKVHNPEDKTWMMMTTTSKLVKTIAMPMTTCLVIDESSMIRSRRFVFFPRLYMFASSSSSANFGSMNVLKVAVWTRIVGKQQCSHNPEAMAPSIVNDDLSRLGIWLVAIPKSGTNLSRTRVVGTSPGMKPPVVSTSLDYIGASVIQLS